MTPAPPIPPDLACIVTLQPLASGGWQATLSVENKEVAARRIWMTPFHTVADVFRIASELALALWNEVQSGTHPLEPRNPLNRFKGVPSMEGES